jgi:hypothetical protein
MNITINKKRVQLTNISQFVGRLVHKETNKSKLCDACKQEKAMWLHQSKNGKDIFLCFGCGDH